MVTFERITNDNIDTGTPTQWTWQKRKRCSCFKTNNELPGQSREKGLLVVVGEGKGGWFGGMNLHYCVRLEACRSLSLFSWTSQHSPPCRPNVSSPMCRRLMWLLIMRMLRTATAYASNMHDMRMICACFCCLLFKANPKGVHRGHRRSCRPCPL